MLKLISNRSFAWKSLNYNQLLSPQAFFFLNHGILYSYISNLCIFKIWRKSSGYDNTPPKLLQSFYFQYLANYIINPLDENTYPVLLHNTDVDIPWCVCVGTCTYTLNVYRQKGVLNGKIDDLVDPWIKLLVHFINHWPTNNFNGHLQIKLTYFNRYKGRSK